MTYVVSPADRQQQKKRHLAEAALLFAALALLTYPLFFEIYRSMAFETMPRDTYDAYLLYLLGDGGSMPGSAFAYRILSVLAAAPIYELVPPITFSQLDVVDPVQLRAKQAMAATSYLAILATATVIFFAARRRLGCSRLVSAFGAVIAVFLFHFTSMQGIDPIGILTIALLLTFIERPYVFAAIMIVAAFVNEKIALSFVMLFAARLVFDPASRRTMIVQAGASAASLALYFAAVAFVDVPDYPLADELNSAIPLLGASLARNFTLRGLVLNVLPFLILLGLGYVGFRHPGDARSRAPIYFHPAHILVPIGLFLICQLPGGDYGAGRITMYSFPIVLLPFVGALSRFGGSDGDSGEDRPPT